MNLDLLSDPLFAIPAATGLIYALLLPLIGCYLRLRDEWLAALAFAQTAAAGALTALALSWPPFAGGFLAGILAAGVKHASESRRRLAGGAAYALLLLAGWSLAVLLAANLPVAERLGHALFDGQLYFTDRSHLITAAVALLLAAPALLYLSQKLLLARLFPDFFRARGLSERGVHLGFDLLAASVLGLATLSIGVMAAFALVFVPPLVAAAWARCWRGSLKLAVVVGGGGYLIAFAAALVFDQPFGPLLALLLVVAGGGLTAVRR